MASAAPEQNRRPSTAGTIMANSAEDMRRLGARLGQAMGVGDVVALVGPLGAGKTTFAQGLAQGLGVAADRHVASPSFALVSEHPGRTPFVHADFYRLRTRAELPELGIEEAYEWADRFPEALPADHLQITLTVQEAGPRRLDLRATGPRSQRLAAVLART